MGLGLRPGARFSLPCRAVRSRWWRRDAPGAPHSAESREFKHLLWHVRVSRKEHGGDLSVQIVVFCHVEPGTCLKRMILYDPPLEEGITVAIPRIVEFADDHDIPLTFALTPSALAKNQTDLSGHELGLHLHPQDAILRRAVGQRVVLSSDCLATYDHMGQSLLIEAAKGVFESYVGRAPRVFVAGRWSENDTTLSLLRESGFEFDGSPLPGHRSECADWSRIPRLAQPFSPNSSDYQARGSLPYLYIPVSQGMWNHYLTPELIHLLGVSYFRAALKEASVGRADVVHFYFHSPMAIDSFFLGEFGSVADYARDELAAAFVLPSALRPSARSAADPFPPAYLAGLNWRLAKTLLARGELGTRIMGGRGETITGAENSERDGWNRSD